MKNLATKERKRDREEFCYRYREEIEGTEMGIDKPYNARVQKLKGWRDMIAKARKELGYSERTSSVDIWCSILKTLKGINKQQKA